MNQTSNWKTTNLPTVDDATSKSRSIYAVNALRICKKICKIHVAVNVSISPGYAIIALRFSCYIKGLLCGLLSAIFVQ